MRNVKANLFRPGILLALILLVFGSPAGFAHPMGNFSVNHYSKITIGRGAIYIRYLIDMAEIPTFQEMRQWDMTPAAGNPGASRYLDMQEQVLKGGLTLEFDGRTVALDAISRQMTFADGAGGLPTMKIGLVFGAKLDADGGAHELSYIDNNFAGPAGWKEIVVLGDGVTIVDSSASGVDRSQELTNYSSDALNSPPQQLSAQVSYKMPLSVPLKRASTQLNGIPSDRKVTSGISKAKQMDTPERQLRLSGRISSHGPTNTQSSLKLNLAPAVVPLSNAAQASNTPRSRFTELISTQGRLSLWLAFSRHHCRGPGALHALEPGHGKTIVAAYLVGSRGTAKHAVLLGLVVTAAHTAGVYLLGAVTLYASRYIVPDQLYPWLGAISGLSIAGLGVFIFLRHLTGESGEHSHSPGEKHGHWFLSMVRPASPSAVVATQPASSGTGSIRSRAGERPLSLRQLCMLGITGGIVPCPAALVVLLSAFSLHRIGFGLYLITAFSSGLAMVLVTIGLVMVYAKRAMSARLHFGGAAVRFLPFLSSAFMSVVGIGIAVSAIASVQLGKGLFSKDKLVPFVTVILLGLFLGMRHSTDADHVVAVSRIVSSQRSVRSSATIGLLWGLGHTVTIFLVGSAIIVFGVVIPARLGLSMEFSVALMLIVLGLLDLSGIMHRPAKRLDLQKQEKATRQPEDDGMHAPGQGIFLRLALMLDKTIGKFGVYQTIRPLVVGLVHGLAGSAAVALLVLSTIKSPLWSTAYLLVFGIGTMAGMMLMTSAIAMPLVYAANRCVNINRHLATISGLASTVFGVFLAYHIGFVDGLFTSQTHWIPQ
jgi:ABC-type nickel/cobalt efflux system permease component RcnA